MSEETTKSTGARPVFLTVLCILSFIAAGFAVFGYITVITLMGAASALTSGMEAMEGMEGMEGMSALTTATPSAGMTWAYVIVGFVTTIVALIGVLKMWKLKKQGFMIYAGASIVSLIMSIVYSGFGVVGAVITIGFIVMYYLNVKHMS